MKFKNIILITLLLSAVVTLGCVSAADNLTATNADTFQESTSKQIELDDGASFPVNSAKTDESFDDVNENDENKLSMASDDIEKDATSQFNHEAFTIQSPLIGGTYVVNENMTITVNREKWIATYVNGYLKTDDNHVFIEIIKDGVVKKSITVDIIPRSSVFSNVGHAYSTSFLPTETGEYCVRVGFATPDMGSLYGSEHVSRITDINYVGNFTFNVVKSPYKLLANDVVKYYGGSQKYTVTLTNKDVAMANAKVKIKINGNTQTVTTNSKGQASVALNLGVGTHEIISEYADVKVTSKATVKSTITTSNSAGKYLNSTVTATFLDTAGKALASKQVTFKVGDKTFTATTNNNGVATANINLNVGNYTVTAVNPTTKEEKQFKLTISKSSSRINLTSSQKRDVITVTATLTPATATGSVIFKGLNQSYTIPTINGKASVQLKLKNIENDWFSIVAFYEGDNNLNGFGISWMFDVNHFYHILTANSLTKTYGASNKLVVKLADNNGNATPNAKVNVTINNKITPITTDSNGKATMPINLKPGTYTAVISYDDDEITTKIVVKKATPKLTAAQKTFKKSVKTKANLYY